MPAKITDATPSNFNQVFDNFKRVPTRKVNLILFLADVDPATGRSWCPYCAKAEPAIYKKLEAMADDVAVLRVYVGDKTTWKNPLHPLRTDSRFRLKGVPTIIRWGRVMPSKVVLRIMKLTLKVTSTPSSQTI